MTFIYDAGIIHITGVLSYLIHITGHISESQRFRDKGLVILKRYINSAVYFAYFTHSRGVMLRFSVSKGWRGIVTPPPENLGVLSSANVTFCFDA